MITRSYSYTKRLEINANQSIKLKQRYYTMKTVILAVITILSSYYTIAQTTISVVNDVTTIHHSTIEKASK